MIAKVTNQKPLSKKTQKALDWINSREGQAKMQEAYIRACKKTDSLRKARDVDWSIIHQPMTI